MGAPVLSKIFLIFFSLGFFGQEEKIDVPRIQRAIVKENQAIVYTQPDFDAKQMMELPSNKIIAISTKIYRPKNLFGSFYRIFINKPRKIRGYISEIDVLPQYKKSKKGYVLNKVYQEKEKALRHLKTQLIYTQKKPSVSKESELKTDKQVRQKIPVSKESESKTDEQVQKKTKNSLREEFVSKKSESKANKQVQEKTKNSLKEKPAKKETENSVREKPANKEKKSKDIKKLEKPLEEESSGRRMKILKKVRYA